MKSKEGEPDEQELMVRVEVWKRERQMVGK